MIKPILKTLSFSFVTLASAAILSASDQGPATAHGTASGDPARVGCPARSDIDQGWEERIAQIEKRLAEKEAEGLAVRGAIITPPFEAFPPYRTDVPPAVAARTPRPVASGQASHD